MIKQINKILNCKNYARIDCFFKKETKELIFIEFNTLPALTPATCLFHQALEIGLKPAEFLQKIIEDALISDLSLTINKKLDEQTKLNFN